MKFGFLFIILAIVGILAFFGIVREDRILGLPKFISALLIAAVVVGLYLWSFN